MARSGTCTHRRTLGHTWWHRDVPQVHALRQDDTHTRRHTNPRTDACKDTALLYKASSLTRKRTCDSHRRGLPQASPGVKAEVTTALSTSARLSCLETHTLYGSSREGDHTLHRPEGPASHCPSHALPETAPELKGFLQHQALPTAPYSVSRAGEGFSDSFQSPAAVWTLMKEGSPLIHQNT